MGVHHRQRMYNICIPVVHIYTKLPCHPCCFEIFQGDFCVFFYLQTEKGGSMSLLCVL